MINNTKYQSKLAVSSVVFGLVALAAFMFVFPFQQRQVDAGLSKLLETKKTVLELRQEQKNMLLAKQDIDEVKSKNLQPEDFFSRDTTLVSEIRNLESLASKLSVSISLSVSGTVNSGVKVSESKALLGIPYNLTLTGQYSDVARFLESMENSANLISVRSVSLGASGKGEVSAGLTGAFYIKQ